MTITDIDKQFSKEYDKGMFRNDTATGDRRLRLWFIDFLHQIYSQAKSEQREEDVRIAEGKKKEVIFHNGKEQKLTTFGYQLACDDIAKEIRSKK